jgi:hypothetical protein
MRLTCRAPVRRSIARTRERARLSGGGPDTASTYAFMQLDYAASQRA